MRLDQLCLRIPGDEFRLRFHERLTVLSGIGVLERRALVDSLFSALTGGPESSELTYVDATGQRVTVVCERGRLTCTGADGDAVPSITEQLGKEAAALRSLMVLTAADLGLHGNARTAEPPELAEARATLAAMTEELYAAKSAAQAVEAMRAELEQIDERIRVSEDNRARRQFARLLRDLERVRAEAAALRSGRTGADGDRHLLRAAGATREAAVRWRDAAVAANELLEAFGDAERVDQRTLQDLVTIPGDVPAHLDTLVEEVERAEATRVALSVRLRESAASRLPEPSHPCVADLARLDQRMLWAACGRALRTAEVVSEQSMALGGLGASGADGHAIETIERQHEEVVEAEERVQKRRKVGLASSGGGVAAAAAAAAVVPVAAPVVLAGAAGAAAFTLLSPKRRLARAQRREQEALDEVGAATYLSFHLRRVDAMIDPNAREGLELAALEHRMALSSWTEIAGDVDPVTADELRDEIADYAASLRDLGGEAEEIEALRHQLIEVVEPAAEAARAALLAACEPFGIDDPFLADALIRHQVGAGHVARLQARLEAAEQQERTLRGELDAMLRDLGFADGDVAARMGAFEWAHSRAAEREKARTTAREPAEVEADLAKLEDEVNRTRRPEWASVTPSEADAPDMDDLLARREATVAALGAGRSLVPDVARLVDRHNALERRVAVLESGFGGGAFDDGADPADVRQYLLARLTQANSSGPDGDPLPVIVDEALVRLQGDAKWELLDLLERVAQKAQLIYLSDDPYVGAWARRRAAAGGIALLEPVAEPVG